MRDYNLPYTISSKEPRPYAEWHNRKRTGTCHCGAEFEGRTPNREWCAACLKLTPAQRKEIKRRKASEAMAGPCPDDMCRGAGECFHGDGERLCPTCKGRSAF